MTRSATNVLGSEWPRSVLQRVLLFVTPAPDSVALPAIAGAPFNSANRSTQTSIRMTRANKGVSKKEPGTVSKLNVAKTPLVNGNSGKKRKQKKWM